MKYNLELLKADILDELTRLEKLEEHFSEIEELLAKSAEEVTFFERSGLGYYLHCFYNGCENIFRSIARFFENDIGPQTWHADLLKRMKLNVPNYRPPLIDEQLYKMLDDFRGFRHKFRHSYSFELDWERELSVARKFIPASKLMKKQTHEFLAQLEDIEC